MVSIGGEELLVDLFESNIVVFQYYLGDGFVTPILCINRLWTHKVVFKLHSESDMKWENSSLPIKRKFISYLRA